MSYDALLSGDVLVSLQVVPVLFRKFFALQELLAGIIPRGTYAYGDKASNDTVVSIQRVSARQRDPSPATLEQEERDRQYDKLRMLNLERERLVFEGPTTESDVDAANRKEAELQAFLGTIQRADDGRMVVTLPKDPRYKDLITRNLWSANRRLQSTLKTMKEDPIIRDGLTQTKEYMISEGVLKLTSVDELDGIAAEKGHPWTELSFRGILRPESKTTPVRLVISGDNKDIGGKSTNDWFDSGVNVLPHIPQVITHLRMHKQFILTDLKKAFYQIALSDEDRDLLVFKWSNLKDDGSVDTSTIPFRGCMAMGIKPAPAELNGCLRKLYRDFAEKHPKQATFMRQLEQTSYVDDVSVFGDYDDETIQKMQIAEQVAGEGQFAFEKIVSYPASLTAKLGKPTTTSPFKVLGVGFDPETDQFFVCMKNIDEFIHLELLTKRQAASLLARVYDPLGFAAPALFTLKRLHQEIDKAHSKAKWNAQLTAAETAKWHQAVSDVQN